MGDGLDIRSGGLVAVDTDSLRNAARRFRSLEADLHEAETALRSGCRHLQAAMSADLYAGLYAYDLMRAADVAAVRARDAAAVAGDLSALADMYELVELRARAAAPDSDARGRLAAFSLLHPDAVGRADAALAQWRGKVAADVTSFDNATWWAAGLMLEADMQQLQRLLRTLGSGTIEHGRRGPDAPSVDLRPVDAVRLAPPTDLADALGRIPGQGARIRVETYAMPDGTDSYAVYLAGTRDFSPSAGPDPWDMSSNLQMYFGWDSSAYAAVRQALADADVPAGAPVYLFGHSQGGLIADLLAVEGGYDTRMLVTAGSPTEAVVGESTVSVQLRHTDDLVQSLAAGGSAVPVGGPGSVVVEAVGDPGPGIGDVTLAAHHLTGYVATAAALAGSQDPRLESVRARLDGLRAGTPVAAVEYDATRRGQARAVSADVGERETARRRPVQ